MFGLSDTSLGLTASLLLHVGVVAACCGTFGEGEGAGAGLGVVSVDLVPDQEMAAAADPESESREEPLAHPADPLQGLVEARKESLPSNRIPPRRSVSEKANREVKKDVAETPIQESVAGGGGLLGALFSPIVALDVPKPEYPRAARRNGIEGVVIVLARVEPDGTLSGASIVSSSGHQALDDAAIRSFQDATFKPAMRGGVPVTAEKKFAVRFDITE